MESRKRPLPDGDDAVVNKKRILTGVNGSPLVNGSLEDDENENFRERLETYRKEAIYRRMMHYSREHGRSVERIQELERRKNTCEAGLAAISACWSQLIETVRLFVKTDEFPEVSLHAKELFDLTARVEEDSLPELTAALGDTVNATQALVTKFVQLSGEKLNMLQGETFLECQGAKNECILLRSEVNLLRGKLRDSEAQKDFYRNALVSLENRIERSQSTIVHEIEGKGKSQDQETGSDAIEETRRKPPSPVQSSASATPVIQSNGFYDVSFELQILQEQLKARDAKITELEREATLQREERTNLQAELKAPSCEQVLQNPFFRVVLDHISYQEYNISDKVEENRRLVDELQHVQSQLTSRADLWAADKTDFEQTINDLSYKVEEKNEEIARLRMQREKALIEANERRTRDSVKFTALQEYKSLLESNSERLAILQSELKRCKAQLAAKAGAEDLLNFFLGGNYDETQFFQKLKEEKAQLEKRVSALEETLAGYDDTRPDIAKHMRLQAQAVQRLSEVNVELQKYRQTFGNVNRLAPDVAILGERLHAKEVELEKLRLIIRELEANQSSLYSELDQLALQWESLDKQVKNKVFGLQGMEERVLKSLTEKAKAETKYFEVVKAHQAVESERKMLQRKVEMQEKLVQSMEVAMPKLQQEVHNLELENAALKKANASLQDHTRELEKENPELRAQLELEKKKIHELNVLFSEREAVLQSKRKELRAKEDEFIRYKKELDRQITQVKREAELQRSQHKPGAVDTELENLRSLLICSTCHGPARSTIITKCMHTFCKGCVDARLSTRQRKCPACNLPFGASDVHTFFFQ